MDINERLIELNLVVPEAPAPAGNYVPFVIHRDLVFVTGQIAFSGGEVLYPGKVPDTVTLDEAKASARQCALNLLAVVKQACTGDLNRVQRCIRLDGYVRSADGFFDQASVMNGASDLLVDVLGEDGRHARTAIGVNALPLNASVEINGIFTIK